MGKIWFIKSKYGKKGRYFKTEKEFLNQISVDDKRQFFIYDEVEAGITGEYKSGLVKGRERDIQVRSVLGELVTHEENISAFIRMYTDRCPEIHSKDKYLRMMNGTFLDKKAFSEVLVNNKKYFLSMVSTEVDYYVALLKCHNFRDYKYAGRSYDYVKRTYVENDEPQTIKDNFMEAKNQLRKNKY